MHITCLIQGTASASQETSEKPRDHSSTSRTTPDGQVVTNYMEEKSTSFPGGSCDLRTIFLVTVHILLTIQNYSEQNPLTSVKVYFMFLLGPKPSLDSEAKAPYRVSSAGPHPRPLQEATRAQKPPLPSSGETVSKRVLSAQPRYQPIRVDEIMAKAGTLT